MEKRMASIFLFDPDEEKKITIKSGFSIGRADGNDLVIKDKSVSSQHARIEMSKGKTFVVDLKSFNSTFVNGKEVLANTPHELRESDVLQVGDKAFYFNTEEGNLNFLDMPSFTGTLKDISDKTGQMIIHDYEPVIDLVKSAKKKNFSLRELREQKERIETKRKEISSYKQLISRREQKEVELQKKNTEFDEFLDYLKAKNYQTEDEIKKTISSVNDVSNRILKEMEETRALVKKLKVKYQNFESEVKSNKLIVTELQKDIEIVNGRDSMAIEISQVSEELQKLSEVDYEANIRILHEEIAQEEEALKKAQEGYAESRFGKKAS